MTILPSAPIVRLRPLPPRLRRSRLLLAAAACLCVATAQAAGRHYGHIGFYSDFGNLVGPRNPLVVEPKAILLAEDGSVSLSGLRWHGWGTDTVKATGTWNASSCDPNCADGKVTKRPATMILSDPGQVLGHVVYRCYQILPAHPKQDPWPDHQCIKNEGGSYEYEAVKR